MRNSGFISVVPTFMRTARRLVTVGLPFGLLSLTLLAQNDNGRPEVTPAVKQDVSLPLS
jgi:hypothetical protein